MDLMRPLIINRHCLYFLEYALMVYSINFPMRQIGNNNPFSIKSTVLRVKNYEKNTPVFQFEISLPQASK